MPERFAIATVEPAAPAVRVNALRTEFHERVTPAAAGEASSTAAIFLVTISSAAEMESEPERSTSLRLTAVPPKVALKVPAVMPYRSSSSVLTFAELKAAERTKGALAFLW